MGHIGAHRLTEEKAQIIKELVKIGDWTHGQIGEFFGVSRPMITLIANGQRWNDENKSFVMKNSNHYREFSSTYKPQKVKGVKLLLEDGRELDF